MSLVLRPACSGDVAYLLALEEACMRAYAEALWGTWRPRAGLDPAGHEIVVEGGIDVGCVATTLHADCLFIDKLYVDPAFQGRGIGTAILRRKVDAAAARGLPTTLSVLVTNPADRLYRREGFVVVGETPERRRMTKPLAPA